MKDRFGIDWSNVKGTHFWRGAHMGRRMFFRHAASALGGYFLLPSRPQGSVAQAAPSLIGTAKYCIFVLMSGAPSHVDTFDFKEGSWTPAYMQPESYDGVRFPKGLMPKLGDQMDNIAFLRSVRSWVSVHGLGQTWVQIARNPITGLARIAPHMGSVASLELAGKPESQTLPVFVALNTGSGPGSGYFEPRHAPFYVNPNGAGLANTTHPSGQPAFDRRYGLLLDVDSEMRAAENPLGAAPAEIATFSGSARRLMYNTEVNAAFTFSADERARYGNTGFGNACIAARNLLQRKLGTRFIQITIGGWDHHANIYQANGQLQTLSRQFDNGLGTLMEDLKQAGLLDETLIVAMGEFGRTVGALNNQGGRDHFLQQAVFMAGARIRGKRAIGATDEVGRATTETGWKENRDIRTEDVAATIYSALGIDWTTMRTDDPLGRGFEYIPTNQSVLYAPVNELWG